MGKKLFCGIIDLHGKGLTWLGSFHLKWSSKLESQNWKVHYPKGTRGGLGGEVQLVSTKCWSIMVIVANCNNFQDINSFWPSASKFSFFKFHFTECIKIFILQISFESLSMFKFIEVLKVLLLLLVFIFFWNMKVLHMKVAWQWVLCTSLLQPSINPSVLVII